MRADHLEIASGSIGCVVCCEMLEHDDRVWISVQEFHRVLKPGGFALVTTVGIAYPKHEYPSDYWRFTTEGLNVLMGSVGFESIDVFELQDGKYTMGIWRKAAR